MNIISVCCAAPIVTGQHVEYPLGGRMWRQVFSVDVCEKCGREAEPLFTCEYCGAVLDGDNPGVPGMDQCYMCCEEE